ncbi:hypothetical protein GQ42DRAFT_158148 [Ramicandelaber brevisporus]|nr:hypothetical protein GQ42DRAFT_158148 [Ramicandelaber brevisporus]
MNLLDLPRDILLYLTDFFKDSEAFPLLTISSQFHDLFARAAWRIVDAKTLELDPVTRSAAFARYGHLVRFVTVRKHTGIPLLYPPNWHLKLPHVVRFCFIINHKLSAEFKRRIFVGIRSLVHLHRVMAYFEIYKAPYTSDGLASIILARHRDATKRKLTLVVLMVRCDYALFPWVACVRFCRKLRPLNIPKLGVKGYPVEKIYPPSVAQCHYLAPHLLYLEPYVRHKTVTCSSQLNGRYFNNKSVVFPLLETLNLTLCCNRTEVFDLNCVTPEKFTSLQKLHIIESETCVHSIEDFRTPFMTICMRRWPNLRQMMLQGMIEQADLERIFRVNPQLKEFTILYQHNSLASHRSAKHIVEATLNFDWLVHLLPKLESIHLVAPVTLRLDYKPQAVSEVNIGSCLTRMFIDECSVSPAVLIWLLSLPKLKKVSLENTVLADPKSALTLIKRIHKHPIQSRSHESVRLMFSTVKLSEECSQVLVEWVAAMPTLECVVDADAALHQKINRRCPHIKFTEYDN